MHSSLSPQPGEGKMEQGREEGGYLPDQTGASFEPLWHPLQAPLPSGLGFIATSSTPSLCYHLGSGEQGWERVHRAAPWPAWQETCPNRLSPGREAEIKALGV